MVGKVGSVRFLTPDVAMMHTIGGTIMADQTDIEPERNSVQVFTVKKDDKGDWHIAAFANIRAQYIGRPEQSQELTEALKETVDGHTEISIPTVILILVLYLFDEIFLRQFTCW